MKKERSDTIVALSTPPGERAIAVIRMSGPNAPAIAKKCFKTSKGQTSFESFRAYHGRIFDEQDVIDEVVLTVFRAPRSYTGEDVVEISCHGGTAVSRKILQCLVDLGARPAEPGEFTRRAFLNGKLDLIQAEAVADLIHAKSEMSRKVALSQLEGNLSHKLKTIRDRLIEMCSLLEVELDFVEDGQRFVSPQTIDDTLKSLSDTLKELADSYGRGRILQQGIRLVILGRSNVGKSSLLNALLQKERAIVTEVAGTTRDTIEEAVDIGGYLFVLIDTAGIRVSSDSVEKEGIRRTIHTLESSDMVLIVVDGSASLTRDDRRIVDLVSKSGKKAMVIINKIDLKRRFVIEKLPKSKNTLGIVEVSALHGTGITKLAHDLKRLAKTFRNPDGEETVLTSVRHRECLLRAFGALQNARVSFQNGMSQEFLAFELREAMNALGEMTGQIVIEDILNTIFSRFCIGK
jgi:tRNA modification GTPase